MEKMLSNPKKELPHDFSRSGVSADAIREKIAIFKKHKEELTSEEYQQLIDAFIGAINGDNKDYLMRRTYNNWTKENAEAVLTGVDENKELKLNSRPSESNEIKNALERAMRGEDIKKIDPPTWIEVQIELLKEKRDKFLKDMRKLRK